MTTPKVLPTLSPTFKLTVGIPIAGEKETYGVEFTFARMKRGEFREWAAKVDPNNVSAEQVLAMAKGWDLSDTFNGLMMLPNLVGVAGLSGTVARITRNYAARVFYGRDVAPLTASAPRPARR